MKFKTTFATAATGLALLLSTSVLGSGTYYNLGATRSPSGVSANGSVVGGTTGSLAPYFKWELSNPSVTTLIGGVSPGSGVGGTAKVSDDGDRISGTIAGFVGASPIPPTVIHQMGVYDVSDGTWTGLGGIGWFSGTETAGGWAISGDGTKVAGLGWSPNQTNAYGIVSTNGGAPVALPWLVPGRSTRINGCDNDGSVLVGWQDNPFGFRQAAIWVNGVGQRLWRSYPRAPLGEAQACSADGNWVVGLGGDPTGSQAWRWSQSTGCQLLGELNPTTGWNAIASGISADGSVIVGTERITQPGNLPLPFIWTSAGGMQNLHDYLTTNGVTLPGGVVLGFCTNVSADGRTFIGSTTTNQGFVVRIDPPLPMASCMGDTNTDGFVNTTDLLTVINAWGQCQVRQDCAADVTHDQNVDVADLLTIINAWGVCP